MGCLFGACLSPHAEVTLIGQWPEQLRALRHAPLRVIHPDGHEQRVWLRAVPSAQAAGPVDAALIVTKTPKTEFAAQDAARLLSPDGLAISLQNGLGNQAVLDRVLGAQRVTVGVTTLGASTGGQPGVVHWGGAGLTSLATRPAIEPCVRALAGLFEQGGLDVQVVDQVDALLWGKVAVNAAINPLTALLRVPNGALLDSAWARRVLREAAVEVATVAAAQGVTLPFPDASAQAETVARLTAPNRSSMLQDVERGVRTEIDAICGAVVLAGEAAGVPVPTNRLLHALMKALEETYS